MAIFLRLIIISALSALSLFIINGISQSTEIAIQYIVLSVNIVVIALGARIISDMDNAKLKEYNTKLESVLKSISDITDMAMAHVKKADEIKGKREKIEKHAEKCNPIEVKIEPITIPKNTKFKVKTKGSPKEINTPEINTRTGKLYKVSKERREWYREMALKREEKKRLAKAPVKKPVKVIKQK